MLGRGELKGIRVGGQWRFPIENLAELLPSAVAAPPKVPPPPVPRRAASIQELIEIGGIHYRIGGDTPNEVLREVVNETSCIPTAARPALFKAIWERESLCSTGIGNGIAVPHPIVPMWAPRAEVPSFIGLYFLEHPVDFGYVDKEKVSVLFLLLLNTLQEHLRMLARLVRLLREESLQKLLREVPLRAEIHGEIARLEKAILPGEP
jgi:PTS system nitrogen regulatory IIA component